MILIPYRSIRIVSECLYGRGWFAVFPSRVEHFRYYMKPQNSLVIEIYLDDKG